MKKYRDHYFMRAKQENYPARSVYKLQEIDKRFHVLAKGQRVLDLGAAPGSWSMWAAKKIAPNGRVLAVDLQAADADFAENVTFMQEDVFDRSPAFEAELAGWGLFDLVMSDMAPKTTGIKFTDQARSLELALEALALAHDKLINGGSFVVKIFMGPDERELHAAMKPLFVQVKVFKPVSSRAESKETFYIGLGFKRPQDKALVTAAQPEDGGSVTE